jgi:hypothetical protein
LIKFKRGISGNKEFKVKIQIEVEVLRRQELEDVYCGLMSIAPKAKNITREKAVFNLTVVAPQSQLHVPAEYSCGLRRTRSKVAGL